MPVPPSDLRVENPFLKTSSLISLGMPDPLSSMLICIYSIPSDVTMKVLMKIFAFLGLAFSIASIALAIKLWMICLNFVSSTSMIGIVLSGIITTSMSLEAKSKNLAAFLTKSLISIAVGTLDSDSNSDCISSIRLSIHSICSLTIRSFSLLLLPLSLNSFCRL